MSYSKLASNNPHIFHSQNNLTPYYNISSTSNYVFYIFRFHCPFLILYYYRLICLANASNYYYYYLYSENEMMVHYYDSLYPSLMSVTPHGTSSNSLACHPNIMTNLIMSNTFLICPKTCSSNNNYPECLFYSILYVIYLESYPRINPRIYYHSPPFT